MTTPVKRPQKRGGRPWVAPALVVLGGSLSLVGARQLMTRSPTDGVAPKDGVLHVGAHRAKRHHVAPPRVAPTPVREQATETLATSQANTQANPERGRTLPNVTAYQRSFVEPALEVLQQFQRRSELTGNAAIAAAIELERANLMRAASGLPEDALPVER